jgi:hypothetical protein
LADGLSYKPDYKAAVEAEDRQKQAYETRGGDSLPYDKKGLIGVRKQQPPSEPTLKSECSQKSLLPGITYGCQLRTFAPGGL